MMHIIYYFFFLLCVTTVTPILSAFIPTPSKTCSGTTTKNKEIQLKSELWGIISISTTSSRTSDKEDTTIITSTNQEHSRDSAFIYENLEGIDMIRLLDSGKVKTIIEENKCTTIPTVHLQNELEKETIVNTSSNEKVHLDGNYIYSSNNPLIINNRKPLGIIIAGAPASGKGTQCELIKETYGLVHLSTGDMLRAAVKAESDVGKAAKEYMDNGKLVPDELIINIVKERIRQEDCETKGWLLDGFPRTREQAEALSKLGITADCFFFLNVPDSQIVQRVTGRRTDPNTGKIYNLTYNPPPCHVNVNTLIHRSDDTEEKVNVRLQQFHDHFNSVKECYENIMVEIDGNQRPEHVADFIADTLKESHQRISVMS